MDQSHVLDYIPAYVLGILEPEENLQVVNHLKVCPSCQAELKAYQEVVGALATTLPQNSPPPRVKTAILKQVSPLVPKPGIMVRLQTWLFGPGALMRVSAAALILVLAASNVLLWNQVTQLNQRRSQSFDSVPLEPTDNAPEASGMIVYTTDGRYGLLVVDGLDSLPEDQQYQLWLVKGDERTSGGVFSVGRSGYHVMEVKSKIPLNDYDRFGITIEPFGGSPGPTGDRVLAGSF